MRSTEYGVPFAMLRFFIPASRFLDLEWGERTASALAIVRFGFASSSANVDEEVNVGGDLAPFV